MNPAENVNRLWGAHELGIFNILGTLATLLLLAFGTTFATAQSQQKVSRDKDAVKVEASTAPAAVESIFVAHSSRVSASAPPTSFCDKAPFKATREAYMKWLSVETRPEDGRLSNSAARVIGDIRGCFGSSETQAFENAYTEGTIAGIPFKGIGTCETLANFPENGITHVRCFQSLSGLPKEYMGGVILNNGIRSQNGKGDASDPPGYLQSGIATIRLWKRRTSDR